MDEQLKQDNGVGFAYVETSKKGLKYLSVTLDVSKIDLKVGKVKLTGFITSPEDLAKSAAAGKSAPNIRFIQKFPQVDAGKPAGAKAANKSTGLPF